MRARDVNVAREKAAGVQAQKELEQQQRVRVASLEAEAIKGESQSKSEREIVMAQREAETQAAKKAAEQEQRIRVAESEARATTGENTSRALMAESNAKLAEIQAESKRRAEVAQATALQAILIAQREQELARLSKEQLAAVEVEKQRIEIAAEAEAEKRRREAQGEADAIKSRFQAEAEGVRLVLEAKAEGYRKLIEACGGDSSVGPTLLLIEQLPKLVAEQVKAVQGLKIDKITVWDSGTTSASGRNTTADFISGMVGALPRLHELASQAGIQLPAALGKLNERDASNDPPRNAEKKPKAEAEA